MMQCDPVTGVCLLPESEASVAPAPRAKRAGLAVRYIGDPMCSWCWGVSPAIHGVAEFCEAEGIEFSATMGGLRVGGGDPWNSDFKNFLREEWRHIAQVTGQPFGFDLLEAPHFDYDTEPACRAVAVAKLLQARRGLADSFVLKFLAALQRKFYVEGQDPKALAFYASICADLDLDFEAFASLFESVQALQAVQQEFARCRLWRVRSFPTILFERDGERQALAVGAIRTEQALARLKQAIAA